jgi:endoglucanase
VNGAQQKDTPRTARPRNRRLHRTAGLLVALVTAGSLACGTAVAAPAEQAPAAADHTPRSAMAAVAQMQPSWNLGNALDTPSLDETAWGNPLTTKAVFDRVRAQGFRSVRIPVTWFPHQSATAPYTIDPAWLKRVKQVVDWALEDGLYVEINLHHDSTWVATMVTDHDNVLARFNATWQQIAAYFKDEPRKLLMESINEPQFPGATDAQKTQYMNELNTSFHDIVRNSGGRNKDRLLVLPAEETNSAQHWLDDLSTTMSSLGSSGCGRAAPRLSRSSTTPSTATSSR